MKKTMKLLARMEKTVLDVSIAMFVILIAITVFQITSRNLIGKSYIQLEELAIMMLPWFGFTAATYVLFRNNHVQIEFIYEKLPAAIRKTVFLLTQLAILVFIIVIAFYNLGLVARQMKLVTPALGWPMGYQYLGFPICAVFMVFPVLANIYGLFTGRIEEFKAGRTVMPKEEVL